MANSPNEELDPADIAASLSDIEVRVMSLLALGKANAYIETQVYITTVSGVIKRCIAKCGVSNKLALALFYIDHVLPIDTVSGYSQPGEKLAEWRRRAEEWRSEFEKIKELGPRQAEAVMLLADPANAALTDEELGAKMPSSPISASVFGEYINRYVRALPANAGEGINRINVRLRLAAIARLAPLVTGQEPQ